MPKQSGQKSLAMGSVTVVSVLWLVACGLLFWQSAPCDAAAVTYLGSHITCRPMNEIGDALAGAMAPLAFLWLIAAVLLQRQELQAQRQELRESREVASQHVTEARKNVAFIEEQTSILGRSRVRDEMEFIDNSIEKILILFVKTMKFSISDFTLIEMYAKFDDGKPKIYSLIERFDGDDFDLSIRHFCLQLDLMAFQWQFFDDSKIAHRGFKQLETAVRMLGELVVLSEKGTPPTKSRIEFLGIPAALSNGLSLIEIIKERGQSGEMPDQFWGDFDDWWQYHVADGM